PLRGLLQSRPTAVIGRAAKNVGTHIFPVKVLESRCNRGCSVDLRGGRMAECFPIRYGGCARSGWHKSEGPTRGALTLLRNFATLRCPLYLLPRLRWRDHHLKAAVRTGYIIW